MEVRCVAPVDDFSDTLSIPEWIGQFSIRSSTQKWSEFMDAVNSVTSSEFWVLSEMSIDPCVCYNKFTGKSVFVFKLIDNGLTFLVGWDLSLINDDIRWLKRIDR